MRADVVHRDVKPENILLERAATAREALGFLAPFGLPAYDPIRGSARFAAVIRAFGADPAPFVRPAAAHP